jgi:hypothetical protein
MGSVTCVFEVSGYGCVLPHVQNYYPVEEDKPGMFCWGFKYISGVFEFFYYPDKQQAVKDRQSFIDALDAYWATNSLPARVLYPGQVQRGVIE